MFNNCFSQVINNIRRGFYVRAIFADVVAGAHKGLGRYSLNFTRLTYHNAFKNKQKLCAVFLVVGLAAGPTSPYMTIMPIHLIKMAAGIESYDHLVERQQLFALNDPTYGKLVGRHWTKHRPKRADEIEGVASIFWVFKGAIRARQPILALEVHESTDEEGKTLKRCAIVLDTNALVPTVPQPRRPHQGWRYFEPDDAPKDLAGGGQNVDPDMPMELRAELAALGLL